MEESTVQGYKNALIHVHSYLGHMRLQELTGEHVESMVTWLLVGTRRRGGQAGTGLRPSTAQHLGRPLTTRHLREAAYSLQQKLELQKVRLYSARHSCLTFLAVNGVSDVALAAWAGHANANFTKRVYVHPSPEDLRAASGHPTSCLASVRAKQPDDQEVVTDM
ncbi:tyrosine-type recombinase/integrase [Streptomyces sp. NPDC018000]|uniref:tyrosine-type recombinase/integrase n=1 Tax=Streptomyces sp. NPDC018000 TaxID=3365028 RepID=UPI0037A9981F